MKGLWLYALLGVGAYLLLKSSPPRGAITGGVKVPTGPPILIGIAPPSPTASFVPGAKSCPEGYVYNVASGACVGPGGDVKYMTIS
jgi:hypothetical protein